MTDISIFLLISGLLNIKRNSCFYSIPINTNINSKFHSMSVLKFTFFFINYRKLNYRKSILYSVFHTEMNSSVFYRIQNHVVGLDNDITVIIPLKRFQKKYGFIPEVKTFGSKLNDNYFLSSISSGQIDLRYFV